MPDVVEQLARYGEALERAVDASGAQTVPAPAPMPSEPTDRSVSARVVAVVVAALVVAVVAVGGWLSIRSPGAPAPADRSSKPPRGAPVAHLRIEALPTLTYQAKEFTTLAGVNEIELVDEGGTHTLVFDDPALSYFALAVPAGPTVGKVDLRAGHDYRIGDTIAGHRAAGMHAVVHVLSKAEARAATQPPDGCAAVRAPGTSLGGCELSLHRAERYLGFPVTGPPKLPASWRLIRRTFRVYPNDPSVSVGTPRLYNRVWAPEGTDLAGANPSFLQIRVRAARPGETLPFGSTVDLGNGRVAKGIIGGQVPGSEAGSANLDWIENGKLYHLSAQRMTDAQLRAALASLR